MSCSPKAPIIVGCDREALALALAANRRGYTPEWRSTRGSGDAGVALNEIMARYLEIQGNGLNAMPQSLQLEFLDTLGANVLPPQPARAPLVFKLIDTASGDATVPQGTRVGAVLPPPAPSLASDAPPPAKVAPEFYTEQAITAMRGKLVALYSIDPQADLYGDHSAGATNGFVVFDDLQPVPHRLYLGHSELFKLTGSAQIVLSFDFATARGEADIPRPLLLDWEFLSADGWQPLTLIEDGTQRFTRDGKITLGKFFGPDSKEDIIGGHASHWIRGTVSSRPPHARVSIEPGGYLVRFQPVVPLPPLAAGDTVQVATQTSGSVVSAVLDGRLILATPLPGAKPGASLEAGGTTLGTITSAPESYRVAVESARDLLPGDIITLDGTSHATILLTDDASLYLSIPISGAQPGLTVELADALPPLRPDGADAAGVLPQVDLIRARVGFGKQNLPLDSAYVDSASLDISKDFYPFGEQPARFATFYATCKEAFTRNGARIELVFTYNQAGRSDTAPLIVAEFFDGARWQPFGPNEEYVDGTQSFTHPQLLEPDFPLAKLSFAVPAGWVESEVNGEKGRWLRLRLASGDYGKPLSVDVVPDPDPAHPGKFIVESVQATLQPPIVSHLGVNYYYFTNPQSLDYCVSENDFAFAEHSDDARWPRSAFAPFVPVADRMPALHFGFSSKPPAALVSLLLQVIEAPAEGDPQPYVWDYWGSRGWTELSVRDSTLGLRRTAMIQFVGAPDALPREGLGGSLYRIRARLKSGINSQDQIVRCGGAWLNAVWARQGQAADRDGLGSSNGNPDQSFALPVVRALKAAPVGDDGTVLNPADFERALDTPLAGVPILGNEILEVREWSGRGDDWQTVLAGVDPADLRFEIDPQDPSVKTAAWVRWHAQAHFYRSGSNDRHYVVERARGIFRFPGIDGFIPPAGAPIVVSYVTGGGPDGNVPAGAVSELRSGVGFMQSVSNPIPAGGGAAAELLRAARDRSVQQMRHRDRAVSVEDYEWLALAASAEVARVRALPLEGPGGRGSRGYVGIVLVPHSSDAQPFPSAELARSVLAALVERVPAGLAGGLRIVDPDYVAVGVRAEILPRRADDAGRVEALVRARLFAFLHPLNGGHEGHGWAFGQSVYLSDLARLIEDTPGVDAVQFLQLMTGQGVHGDSVPMAAHQLIAAGDSQLKIIVPSLPYALA